MNKETIDGIIEKHKHDMGGLISVLEEVQAKFGYLPEESLQAVSEALNRPLVEVYGVATFFRAFSLKPRGKHLVSACVGTACHVRGTQAVVRELQRVLGVKPGETTPDKEFTLETVACLGACALGPMVVIDGHFFSKMNPSKVKGVIEKARAGLDAPEGGEDEKVFPLVVRCPRCNHSLMDSRHPIDGKPSIKITVSFGGKHGWIRLSSLYGSYKVDCEFEIPFETLVNFFCPHCHAELNGSQECGDCRAPMVPLIVEGGGMVQICSRRGCKSHMLDLDGVNFDM